MVDEKDFFRDATLRICGSLEIEKALWNCFTYIRDYAPADMILMQVYDPGTAIMEVVVRANAQGGKIMSLKLPVSQDTRRIISDMARDPQRVSSVITAEHVSDHPFFGFLSTVIGNPNAAVITLGLRLERKLFGGIVIWNNRGEPYTEGHVRLFSLLNEPFAIAFSNYMRYREVSRLKDMLADDNRY